MVEGQQVLNHVRFRTLQVFGDRRLLYTEALGDVALCAGPWGGVIPHIVRRAEHFQPSR